MGPARTVYWAEDAADDRFLIKASVASLASAPAITFFENGQALLEGLARGKPDLVVLDIRMPRLDGIEALEAIRTDPALRHVRDLPVVMFSMALLDEEVEACLRLGASSFVKKPRGFHLFAQAVRTILTEDRGRTSPSRAVLPATGSPSRTQAQP